MSKGEDKLFTILRAEQRMRPRDIKNLTREKTFRDLKYKGTLLRYDFYFEVKGKPVLCEFDGEGHFQYIKFFHKNLSTFKHLKENDRRKNKYALNREIPLFRIPYTDIDSINSIEDILRPQYRVKSIYHNDRLSLSNKS